jgi:hypothetical protein
VWINSRGRACPCPDFAKQNDQIVAKQNDQLAVQQNEASGTSPFSQRIIACIDAGRDKPCPYFRLLCFLKLLTGRKPSGEILCKPFGKTFATAAESC